MKKSLTFIILFSFIIISAQNNLKEETYTKEKITIKFHKMNELEDETPNYHLTIRRNKKIILIDSVYSKVGEIKYEDFNGDGIKDILIQNNSDVRSNWTYFLYLYDRKNKNFHRIKDFETIKNPKYNKEQKFIESYVMSGRNYTTFYTIEGYKIKDLKKIIYDDSQEK